MMDVSERPLTKLTVKLQRDRQSRDVIFCFCKEKRSLWDSLLYPQRLGQLCFSTKDSDLKRRLKAESWTENSKRVCDESELQMDTKDTHRYKRQKKVSHDSFLWFQEWLVTLSLLFFPGQGRCSFQWMSLQRIIQAWWQCSSSSVTKILSSIKVCVLLFQNNNTPKIWNNYKCLMFLKEISSGHQDCIYLIKINLIKILW